MIDDQKKSKDSEAKPAEKSGIGRRKLLQIGGVAAAAYAVPRVALADAPEGVLSPFSTGNWTCKVRSLNSAPAVANWLIGQLNDLSGEQALTAKVMMSDYQTGKVTGAIYYWTNPGTAPPIPPEQDVWMDSVFQGQDDRFGLAKTALDNLTDAQEAGALMVAEDWHTGGSAAAKVGLLWPNVASNTDVIPPPPVSGPDWKSNEVVAGSDLNATLPALRSWINNNLSFHQVTMKVAASNQHDGNARAVVFWRDPWVEASNLPASAASWALTTFQTGTDYSGLYSQTSAALDNIEGGPDGIKKAGATKIAFTNAKGSNAYMFVFEPNVVT